MIGFVNYKAMNYYNKELLRCIDCSDLRRVGRNKDGGYVVPQRIITNTNYLISGGIYTDWSFESHFKTLCDVHNYYLIDKTSNLKGIFNTTLTAIKNKKVSFFRKFHYLVHGIYHAPRTFIWRKLVKDHFIDAFLISSKDKNIVQDDMVSLDQIIDKLSKKNKKGSIFIKLDIEGSEWGMIDDIANAVDLLSGIVMEVHELHINGNKLDKLIQKFEEVGLLLVHVHPNNYGDFCPKSKLPKFLEITFMNKKYFSEKELTSKKLPPFFYRKGVDFPCNKRLPELL